MQRRGCKKSTKSLAASDFSKNNQDYQNRPSFRCDANDVSKVLPDAEHNYFKLFYPKLYVSSRDPASPWRPPSGGTFTSK